MRCFVLIAVETFHNIIRKQPRTKEIRRCLMFLHLVKNSILPAQYSYDLTVNSFGKAFAHVRNCLLMTNMCTWHKSNRGRRKTLTDSTRKRHKKKGFSKLCVKIKKKDVIPTYSIFQHVSIIQYLFSAESYFDSRIASNFFIYSFFRRKRLQVIFLLNQRLK